MKNVIVSGLIIFTLASSVLFSGCASIPKEEMDEKEAVIQNLNNQIEVLKQEMAALKHENSELRATIYELDEKLAKAPKGPVETDKSEISEPKMK